MDSSDQGLVKKFIILLGIISVFGLLSVFSSSYMYANEIYGTPYFFVLRQVMFYLIGMLVCFVISKTKFQFWYKKFIWIHLFITMLLILTFIPGLGVEVKGAHRWINFGYIRLQPGELVKYSILLYSLNFFETYQEMNTKNKLINWGIMITPIVILAAQPDFGTVSLCFFVILLTLFLTWFSKKIFLGTLAICFVSSIILILAAPYRVKRFMSYLDPWKDPQNSGFQIIQSFLAFANGSFWGQGIGNSDEKLFYLPEAHNDFILSVIGEEFGFFGLGLIVLSFCAFLFLGLKVALKNKIRVNALFGSSVMIIIGMQCFLNMGVVLGLLPTKGMNLPFISYGGSSLIANFFALGLMLSAYSSKEEVNSIKSKVGSNFTAHREFEGRANYYSNSQFSSKLPK